MYEDQANRTIDLLVNADIVAEVPQQVFQTVANLSNLEVDIISWHSELDTPDVAPEIGEAVFRGYCPFVTIGTSGPRRSRG